MCCYYFLPIIYVSVLLAQAISRPSGMARFASAAASLARVICPELRAAIALRTCCCRLRIALGEGALCALALADRRPAKENVVESCIERPRDETILPEAIAWGRLLVPALLDTLETISPFMCPHLRYFGTKALMKQVRATFELLSNYHCAELLRRSRILHRMARCSRRVAFAFQACLAKVDARGCARLSDAARAARDPRPC